MGNDTNNGEGSKCKRCRKEAKTGLRCVVCGNISHKSCLSSLKNILYLDELNINCCSDTSEATTSAPSAPECTIDEIRIKYLEELLVQKDLIISNQEIAIKALQGQVNLISKELSTHKIDQRTPKINVNNSSPVPNLVNNNKISEPPRFNRSPVNMNSNSGINSHKFTPAGVSSAIHEANTTSKCNDIINLNNTPSSNNRHYTPNLKPKNLLIGTLSDNNQNLKAAKLEKLKYFHSTNWKPATTVVEVKEYLKNIDPPVEVVQLNSRFPEKYSSFKIAAPDSVVHEVLRAEIWPQGIYLNEFFQSRYYNRQILQN